MHIELISTPILLIIIRYIYILLCYILFTSCFIILRFKTISFSLSLFLSLTMLAQVNSLKDAIRYFSENNIFDRKQKYTCIYFVLS